MLENYFKTAHSLARLRSCPTGPFLDGFANALCKSGYAHSTIRGHVRTTAHLGAWMGTSLSPVVCASQNSSVCESMK